MSNLTSIARALAFLLGSAILLNLVGRLIGSSFDANIWWIDFPPALRSSGSAILGLAAVLLLRFAVAPDMSGSLRWTAALLVGLLIAVALADAATFWSLVARGRIVSDFLFPFSMLVGIALGVILFAVLRRSEPADLRIVPAAATVLVVAAAFPLAQMWCFGLTDYGRPADAAVVFGARAYADGRPSPALADRVRTAVELYRRGLVRKLVMSGDRGDGEIHETEAMRRMAVRLGVPADDIEVDLHGSNTQATVRNTVSLFQLAGYRRVVAVSHFYHLPRVKLCYQGAGFEVYTVPARESRTLCGMPWFVAREIPSFWAYYLRALAS